MKMVPDLAGACLQACIDATCTDTATFVRQKVSRYDFIRRTQRLEFRQDRKIVNAKLIRFMPCVVSFGINRHDKRSLRYVQ